MKKMKYIMMLTFSVVAFFIALMPNKAIAQEQMSYKPYFANVDWQFNAPISNDFTDVASGWGVNFEGGMFVTPKIGLALFISYSTNHKYVPTKSFHPSINSTLTTDQERSLFQLPFGLNMRYKIIGADRIFDPYIALKLGAEYVQMSSYISSYKVYDRNWGFYMSPEVGTNIWLSSQKNIGFNVSLYYSYSTNKGTVLDGNIDNLNNIGFRVGMAF